MKLSYSWLKQYLETDTEPVELGKILTNIGLEVEGVESFESVRGGLRGVVTGEVLTCEKHPNADRLSLTTVDVGAGDPVKIICGAPNVAAGQKVAVALAGTTLYPVGREEGLTLKKTKIRGEESNGMICAEDELGLGTDHEGIVVLDEKTPLGKPAADFFDIHTDTVFEIGLTPNRIDGASHLGAARDLGAWFKHRDEEYALKRPGVDAFRVDNHDGTIGITIEEKAGCKRYSGVTISGIHVGESPEWLKNRLRSIGLAPVNNVVDITNFVLHEIGQPLHAFDADKIKGEQVIVKTLPEGTSFVTLDEKERKLRGEDLMICNAEEGMCMAGVFGGIDSGVTEKTSSVFLESACFDPVYIRKTAKHHLLSTDASFRFERGSDPNITVWALKRAALLIKEIAGGAISSDIVDVYPKPVEPFPVEIGFGSMTRLIGKTIPAQTIRSILESMEFGVASESTDGMTVEVPTYRVDVQREADVVEELLRIYGYNNVEFGESLHSTLSYTEKPDKEKAVNTLSDLLSGNGFFEMKSNSLTRTAYFEEDDPTVVHIYNPLSQDLARMRQNLLQGGLEAIAWNINRKHRDLKLYEFGNCYFREPGENKSNPRDHYQEGQRLGIFLTGRYTPSNWITDADEVSYYHIKAWVEQVFDRLGIDRYKMESGDPDEKLYSEGRSYLSGNKPVVTFGKVHPDLLAEFDIDQDVFAAEFDWDLVMKKLKKTGITFEPLPKFPEVKRDLSLELDRNVKFEQLRDLAFKTEKKLLQEIELFDVYEGEKIEEGKKSYALSFTLLDREKTLTDKQIDKVMNKISRSFEQELEAAVRGK